MQRITIEEVKKHPWYLKNLPEEYKEGGLYETLNEGKVESETSTQSEEEIDRKSVV